MLGDSHVLILCASANDLKGTLRIDLGAANRSQQIGKTHKCGLREGQEPAESASAPGSPHRSLGRIRTIKAQKPQGGPEEVV